MSMNEKNRHASVPQPLPANYGPPVPPVGPGPGVGQQPWIPNTVHPSSYMAHPGYSPSFKNSDSAPVRAPGYLPPIHHGGYIPRYPPFDAQCQSFPYGKLHESPSRPLNPSSYTITKHYNSQSPYNETSKDSKNLEMYKSLHPAKEKNSQGLEKNGREDLLSSPSEGKSDSETNLTTTESCPDDTRSPTSCDKQDNFDKNENSMKQANNSNSHSLEPISKKCKNSEINSSDNNSEQDSQNFSSILNSNNQGKKDNSGMHPSYDMRIHNPQMPHGDGMYGMYPDGDRRMHNNPNMSLNPPPVNDSVHYGYRGLSRSNMSDMDKLSDLDFSEKSNTSENVFQVPSISSTTPPKIFPPIPPSPMAESWEEAKYYAPQDDMDTEKVPRKKRKRCGECPGCLQKQNCGRCGPCRSVRSHQICKMRKCESLKTKKEKAAEESMRTGRKSRGGESLLGESPRGAPAEKVNGGPIPSSPYAQADGQMHQNMRNYVDQYHPQGGNSYHPPSMLNSYSTNPHYGSYVPQVPPSGPHHPSMFESRAPSVTADGMADIDSSNSTHRMTNNRLKTLIHSRQNQREHGQLMPLCNPVPEPTFNSSVPISPVAQQPLYASQYLPPSNHIDGMQNTLPFSSTTDSSSSLMHLQQLSPNSVECSPAVAPTSQPASWSEASSNVPANSLENSPRLGQKSPAKPSQNGHAESSNEAPLQEESKAVNGTEQSAESSSSICALESNCERVKTPSSSSKSESENDKSSENKIPVSCDSHVMMPPQTPPSRYTTPNPGFMTPPHAYRPHPAMVPSVHLPPNCRPPHLSPLSLGSASPASTNGVHPTMNPTPNESNCDEPTQSPSFLLNTTTSMNTYINTTSTYNSKLSFSNATCLPTFALTCVNNSSPTYSSGYFFSRNSQHLHFNSDSSTYLLPKGGGTAMSCIDSGRIRDSFNSSDIPPNFGHQQDLPLQVPSPEVNLQMQNSNPSLPVTSFHNATSCVSLPAKPDVDPLDRIEKLRSNTKLEPPQCDCLKNKDVLPSEKLPYYTHLGSGSSVSAIRELMEYRSGEKGNAIRIEKLLYSGKEGKTSQGCPIAKWIIRRSGPEEKFLTVIRHRPGHTCPTAYIIIAMVAWEGVSQSVADMLYQTVVYKTVNFGIPTQRKCGTNEMRTCACQGLDPETCGASFSFGCSWSMYYNGCKFARSKNARKFKLTDKDEEKELEDKLQNLATDVAQLYERMAPDSFQNQTQFEHQASDCRLGVKKGRPFSGVTACIDYCAHSHKDLQNMNNGCTVVVTLTKHRGWDRPEDEQLHVLPLYVMDSTDEFGCKDGQDKKIAAGSLEVLKKYPVDFKVRTMPLKPCKTRGRKPKDGFSPRKLAVQNAFKQLIASGKLHRIQPPEKGTIQCNFRFPNYSQRNVMPNNFSKVQSPEYENNCWWNSENFSEHPKNEKTACKFYAGKHILSTCKNFQSDSGMYSNFSTNSNVSSLIDNQSSDPPASFDSPLKSNFVGNSVYTSAFNSINSSCSKFEPIFTSSSVISNINAACKVNNSLSQNGLSVSKESRFNNSHDSNNNLPYTLAQGLPIHGAHIYSYCSDQNANKVPHTHSNISCNNYSSYSPYLSPEQTNPYMLSTPSFHNPHFYQPNVPLKIPGNYCAASSYSFPFQHSNNRPYQTPCNLPYSGYAQFDSCTVPSPNNMIALEKNNNYLQNSFHPKHELCDIGQNISRSDSSSTKHFQNNNFAENHNKLDTNDDIKYQDVEPDNCSDDKHSLKKENAFISGNIDPYQKCYQNKILNINRANNYNYHLQQSNMILDNISQAIPNDSKSKNVNSLKEGYELNHNLTNFPQEGFYSSHNTSDFNCNAHKLLSDNSDNFSHRDDGTEHYADSTSDLLNGDEIYEGHSDNETSFRDIEVGGVAIALTHGSVLFECAKHELHATTALKNPNRTNPTRISLVFYQHKHLNYKNHGEAEWGQKIKDKHKSSEMCFDVLPNKKLCMEDDIIKENAPVRLIATTPTTSWVTVVSIAPYQVGQ